MKDKLQNKRDKIQFLRDAEEYKEDIDIVMGKYGPDKASERLGEFQGFDF